MLKLKNPTLGNVTQSRTALALFAATLLVGGSVTEASAKSHRHHGHRHHHHASKHPAGLPAWPGATPMPRSPVIRRRTQLLGDGLLLRQRIRQPDRLRPALQLRTP